MNRYQAHTAPDKALFYNLHNIIRIRSDVDLRINYFQCDGPLEKTDLIIKTVDYKPIDRKRCQQVASGLYYSEADDSVISNMRILGTKISWEIHNILSELTELRVSKSYVFFSKYILISPISSVHNLWGLILMVLQIKMLLKNHSYLIGGASYLNGKTVIFSGTGGSGKTLSNVDFIETYGADFMSDDFLIISKDSFYSYPTPMKFRKFNLDFVSYSKFVDPTDKFRGRIRDRADGECDIYFLELSTARFLKGIPFDEGINKLCNLNNRALLYFNERILSFLPYIYKDLSLLELQKRQIDILFHALEKANYFIISAPSTLHYKQILKGHYEMVTNVPLEGL